MPYEITAKLIRFNRPKTALTPVGAVLHDTQYLYGEDNAQREILYFDSANRDVSAHAFVDSENILQAIPWNEVAWHAAHTANSMFWGIELCYTKDTQKFTEIWKRGVWLFAHLFVNVANPKILRVTESNLLSHAQVSDKWHECDHRDPLSYFKFHGKTIENFRVDVQGAIDEMLNASSLENSILILQKAGLILSPDYWKQNAVAGKQVNGEYAGILIHKMAEKIKI